MSTDSQISANRRNAQLSTGPRTEAGKSFAASNAYQHGLRAQRFLLLEPEPDQFLELWAHFLQEYQPMTRTEEIYVERMAIAHYKLCHLDQMIGETNELLLEKFAAAFERSFDRARVQLLEIQQDRKAATQQQVAEAEVRKEARKMVQDMIQETAQMRKIEDLIAQANPSSPAPSPKPGPQP